MKTVFRGAMKGQAGTWCRLVSDGYYAQVREKFLAIDPVHITVKRIGPTSITS